MFAKHWSCEWRSCCVVVCFVLKRAPTLISVAVAVSFTTQFWRNSVDGTWNLNYSQLTLQTVYLVSFSNLLSISIDARLRAYVALATYCIVWEESSRQRLHQELYVMFSSVLLFEGFCHWRLAKATNFLNPLLSWLLGLLCPFSTARRRGKKYNYLAACNTLVESKNWSCSKVSV